MASRTFLLFACLAFVFILCASGCIQGILPTEEPPLLTDSVILQLKEGQTKSFRINMNGSTPTYSVFAANVGQGSAVFEVDPGNQYLGMYVGDDDYVDLTGDGTTEIKISLANLSSSGLATIVIVPSSGGECQAKCADGEIQSAYPSCKCSPAITTCQTSCKGNESQRPYPDCSCFNATSYCTGGIAYGTCSLTKPKYCDNLGSLVDNCAVCGCASGQECNTTSRVCYTPVVTCSNTCPTGKLQNAYPDCTCYTPSGTDTTKAIQLANASTEGKLVTRFETQFAKAPSCTESEFTQKFALRMNRNATTVEINQYHYMKGVLPTKITVNATGSANPYTVTYSGTGGSAAGDILRVSVSVSTGITTATWLDGTSTAQNTQTLTTAEGIGGNCGLILAMNGW